MAITRIDELTPMNDDPDDYRPDSTWSPAGTPHSTRNTGDGPLRIHAAFPTDRIDIRYLERNPAPGTEDREPSAFRYDPRTGEVTQLDA